MRQLRQMTRQVAQALMDAELRRLRFLPCSAIVSLIGHPVTKQVTGDDGESYQLEIEAVWDRGSGKDLRVIVAVDDGGWRTFKPMTGDFIMRLDGSLLGESLAAY